MNEQDRTHDQDGLHMPGRLMYVDRLIDDVLRQRGAGTIRQAAPASLPADEALVAELSALTIMDWPADEAGDRIAARVAFLASPAELTSPALDGSAQGRAAQDGPAMPRHGRRRQIAHSRWWAAAAVGAAAAALVAASVLSGGSQPGAVRHGAAPPVSRQSMRLVDATSSPFRSVGSGHSPFELTCVTSRVCYVHGQPGAAVQRTSDGGLTWRPVAALPDHLSLSASELSCPTTHTCAGLPGTAVSGSLRLAITRDGGAHWRVESLPAPPGSTGAAIDQVSWGTAQACVVHLTDNGPGAVLSTTNGGKTWIPASVIPAGAPRFLYYLRCDSSGECIGLAPTGTGSDGGMAAMRSADNGRTWAVTGSVHLPPAAIFLVSCGDALHCMSAAGDGQISTTSDGGVTWRTSDGPVPSSDTVTSVSCATGLACFVAASSMEDIDGNSHQQTYRLAVIEATSDQGTTWTPVSLPAVGGSPLALVYPLSCPTQAGCIGAAGTARQDGSVREIISSFPAAG